MNDGLAQALLFYLTFLWFACFSRQSKGMRIWMCTCCALILWWMST